MTFSGINGGNCIMSSTAKLRLEAGIIEGAEILKSAEILECDKAYRVQFTGKGAIWNGENLVLSSAKEPYEARIFKSIDGAMSAIDRIGLKTAVINISWIKNITVLFCFYLSSIVNVTIFKTTSFFNHAFNMIETPINSRMNSRMN